MNLETPQDLKHELTPSSKRGQAKQLACRPHQTHLSFFTAVEFYRQRKLPDIPRKSPIHTGLERVTERSRRTSCMGFALFAPLFSFASGRAVPKRTAATKSTIFLCYGPLDTGTGSLGSLPNLIPHHQLIQHSLIRRPNLHLAWPGRPSHTVNKTDISYHQIKNSIIPLFPSARMMSV